MHGSELKRHSACKEFGRMVGLVRIHMMETLCYKVLSGRMIKQALARIKRVTRQRGAFSSVKYAVLAVLITVIREL